ncbi:MAG: diguanylate cyclase [Azoarcus sp.]|jgi:diguanylate cyclase (GGDEF)-like protein|nr:diguanylate cyclase [Azoarcus sp.]
MKFFPNRISRHISSRIQLTHEQVWRLLAPSERSENVRRYAASLITVRIQLISTLFALVVPLWSIIDLLVFPAPVSLWLTLLRFASAVVFAFLAWPRKLSETRPYAQAIATLLVMMMVPSIFYLVSLLILNSAPTTGMQTVMTHFYTFMPTVVLAGLAIFPLTALEIVLLSLPVLITTIIGFLIDSAPMPLEENITILWCMTMMMGVSIFSGMSQSHYMESMVRRAMTDSLTGAASRRSGMEALELSFHLAAMSQQPLSVAFFDIDRFKSINDSFGHDIGDQILQRFAERLRGLLRHSDTLVRWGGEEFLAILPNMPAKQLPIFIDRLRVGGFGTGPDGKTLLTASVGIAETMTDNVSDWPALVELADQRMYEAKRQGRARALLPGDIMALLDLGAVKAGK